MVLFFSIFYDFCHSASCVHRQYIEKLLIAFEMPSSRTVANFHEGLLCAWLFLSRIDDEVDKVDKVDEVVKAAEYFIEKPANTPVIRRISQV